MTVDAIQKLPYFPCSICSRPTRVAHREDSAFDSPTTIKVFVVCDNCYHSVWMDEEFYERFIKENRVI